MPTTPDAVAVDLAVGERAAEVPATVFECDRPVHCGYSDHSVARVFQGDEYPIATLQIANRAKSSPADRDTRFGRVGALSHPAM